MVFCFLNNLNKKITYENLRRNTKLKVETLVEPVLPEKIKKLRKSVAMIKINRFDVALSCAVEMENNSAAMVGQKFCF